MKKRKGFYTVTGSNAALITDDYGYALRCRDSYFKNCQPVRKYATYEAANEAATDYMWDTAPLHKAIPERLRIGHIYFYGKLENV